MLTTITLTSLALSSLLALQTAQADKPATAKPAADQPRAAAPRQSDAPAPLKLGDPAPAFKVDAWVKGEKFDAIEPGKVHVFEFWATWCGPCIAAIPHLTELQKKYPDVRFVGVAASESNDLESSARLEKVKKFVADKGDTMGYRVVYAGNPAKMSRPWMEAAGQSGIPCSFIVDDKGRVAWIGHPMSLDAPLSQVIKGEYDLAKASTEFEKARAAKLAQRTLSMSIRQAQQSGDYGPVVDALRVSLDQTPTDNLRLTAVQILAGPAKRPAEAWPIAETLLRTASGNAMAMNQLAWIIVDPEGGVAEPNLDIAMKAASRACELTKNADGSMLDTMARVHFLKGDVARAIEVQKQAIEKTEAAAMKDVLKKTLDEYESKLKKA